MGQHKCPSGRMDKENVSIAVQWNIIATAGAKKWHTAMWVNLKNITPSEISQSQKVRHFYDNLCEISGMDKP